MTSHDQERYSIQSCDTKRRTNFPYENLLIPKSKEPLEMSIIPSIAYHYRISWKITLYE